MLESIEPDTINAAFEFAGGLFILNHCHKLHIDKSVKGVSILSTLFFLFWGIWNLFYYPHLEQMWSFYGGVFLTSCNVLWITMMAYYLERK